MLDTSYISPVVEQLDTQMALHGASVANPWRPMAASQAWRSNLESKQFKNEIDK